MRPIKFRAWDKVTEKLYKVEMINFESEYVTLETPNEHDNMRHFDEVNLLQYTSLDDKNGVEIYDGDIIVSDEKKGKYCVSYCYDSFYAHRMGVNGGLSLAEFFPGIEVIGNMYEVEGATE